MRRGLSFVSALALAALVAGCATYEPVNPSASPNTDAPQIDNSDAAGPASVPGTSTGPGGVIIAPAPPPAR